jgi:HK97 family phage major capsid protein
MSEAQEKFKEELLQSVHEATRTLREQMEKHGKDSAEAKEVSERIEGLYKKYDEQNSKITQQIARAEKESAEAKERVEELELKLVAASQGSNTKAWKESEEYKELQSHAKTGEHVKILRTDNSVEGGYLVPNEMDTMLLKLLIETSPVRSYAAQRTISSKTLETVRRDSIPTAEYEGEAEEGTTSQSSYGKVTQTVHRITFTSAVTKEELMNNAFDMEALMTEDAVEGFSTKENLKFISGTGNKQPSGIITNSTLQTASYETAATGTLTIDDLIAAQGELKRGQTPMWGWNRQTMAVLRAETSTDGQYLWQPAVAAGEPSTILGAPYDIFQDLPVIANGAYPVFYGDLRRGYRITDREGLSVIRDPYTQKKKDIIEFTWTRYNDGAVILTDAIKLIKIKS